LAPHRRRGRGGISAACNRERRASGRRLRRRRLRRLRLCLRLQQIAAARTAAAQKCSGTSCKIVGAIRRGCAALAVDAKNPCGSYGWAIDAHLGKAENTSLHRCYQYGGHDCVVRAWACDEKG
jgi:hypothetical protein